MAKKSLHILLKKLCEIRGIRWIRILYCYPEEIYDELIETIRDEKKICHYLDIPIQHASDRILKSNGPTYFQTGTDRYCRKAPQGDSGYRTAYNSDHRISG